MDWCILVCTIQFRHGLIESAAHDANLHMFVYRITSLAATLGGWAIFEQAQTAAAGLVTGFGVCSFIALIMAQLLLIQAKIVETKRKGVLREVEARTENEETRNSTCFSSEEQDTDEKEEFVEARSVGRI